MTPGPDPYPGVFARPRRVARLFRAALAAAALCLAASPEAASAEPKTVNILGWSDYFDARALDDFTKTTGIRVVYDPYVAPETVEARLRGAADYDVVVVPGPTLRTLIAAGALRKLDRTKLGGAGNLAPDIMGWLAAFDPGNQYAVAYLWSTLGLAFDADKAETKVAGGAAELSWDTLFKPDRLEPFAECGVYVPDSPEDMFALALHYLRLDPGSKSQTDLRRASDLLGGMRRRVRKFNAADTAGALAGGDICLAVGWSGESLQARARARAADNGLDIAYAIPKEGTLIAIDALAVPRDAPHVDSALAFINFMLRPEIAARNTNATRFANSVPASKPLISKEIVENKAIYPDAAIVTRLFTGVSADAATQKFIGREWARIKTGK